MVYLSSEIVSIDGVSLNLTESNKYDGEMIYTSGNGVYIGDGKKYDGDLPQKYYDKQVEINNTLAYRLNGFGVDLLSGEDAYSCNYCKKYKKGEEPNELIDALKPSKYDEQVGENAKHIAYLRETDWYVIRKIETGKEIPQDVLDARQEARDAIVNPIQEDWRGIKSIKGER